jgi:hypothetical protein
MHGNKVFGKLIAPLFQSSLNRSARDPGPIESQAYQAALKRCRDTETELADLHSGVAGHNGKTDNDIAETSRSEPRHRPNRIGAVMSLQSFLR